MTRSWIANQSQEAGKLYELGIGWVAVGFDLGRGMRATIRSNEDVRTGALDDVDRGVDLLYNGGGPVLLALSIVEGSTVEGSRRMLKSPLKATSHCTK